MLVDVGTCLNGAKYELITLLAHADVAHLRPRPEDEDVHDVLERGAGGVERLLDAVHRAARLLLQARRHVFQDVFAPVRMVVIDRQRGGAGEPEDLSALDLDAGHERHEEALVVVRVVDDFHVLVWLSLTGGWRQGRRKTRDGESSERRADLRIDHRLLLLWEWNRPRIIATLPAASPRTGERPQRIHVLRACPRR